MPQIPLDLPPKNKKPPKPLPRELSKKEKTFSEILEDLDNCKLDDYDELPKVAPVQRQESPILRRKTQQYQGRSDEEIYDELRVICESGDPRMRFLKSKEVGSGASGTVFEATDLTTNERVAIKDIDLSKQPKKEC